MLYDGIAAESAHVSIDGRATASIIDEKKLPEWAASEAVFCQVSQLGEAGAGHARTQWHASAQHFSCVRDFCPKSFSVSPLSWTSHHRQLLSLGTEPRVIAHDCESCASRVGDLNESWNT